MPKIAVSTRKGLFFIDENKSIYQSAFLGDPVSLFYKDPHSGIMYAALDHGHFGVKLQRSHNGGVDWEECGCPVYPEKPDDAEDDKNPWSLKLIWAFASGHGENANQLWCGTIPGGLFLSTDNGDTWSLNESLWNSSQRKEWFGGGADHPGIHSICIDPRNENHIFVGVSCGGVWFSSDAGETWAPRAKGMRAEYMPPDQAYNENIQDPHCIVQCNSNPDVLWCQHHNGIFKTEDAGINWTEISDVDPSTFGFACAVDPSNADKAWFIPAIKDEKRIPVDGKLVVTYTQDGGKTFNSLANGLPPAPAYDLVYRHALTIDASGQHLAFGSTTGSVWSSENAGDSWTHISGHLPPVYAVDFLG